MSIEPPKLITTDGTETTSYQLTTSVRHQFIEGKSTRDIVDIQVKINNQPFKSSAELVEFDEDNFTVPNPNVYPEGLKLDYGTNEIQIRIVDATGSVSNASIATINVVRREDLNLIVEAPTGLRVRRHSDHVEIIWSENDNENIKGYNVYAASESGGGGTGYVKINKNLITTSSFEEENLLDVQEDSVFYDSEASQLRTLLVEEDFNDVPIKTVKDSTLNTDTITGEVKVSTSLSSVEKTNYFSFEHDRQATEDQGIINNEQFVDVPESEPLYYVITAVASDNGRQIESVYSSELVGMPLQITNQLQEIEPKTQNEIIDDYLLSLRNSDREVSGIPGSGVVDLFVEPFASELERIHFITEFIRRSQSFASLLAIDDLDGDGDSDPVSENSYKQSLKSALGIDTDEDVQALIDDSFEKLASNVNKSRGGSEFAIGEVVFYTNERPQNDLVVEEGTLVGTTSNSDEPSVNFEVTSRVVLPSSQRDSYYNVQEDRWEITANIRASDAGEQGNVSANSIERVVGGNASGMEVINNESTRFGKDEESNRELAERCMLSFSGVDSGTEGGYKETVLNQPGVFRTKVIKSGDEHMMRDYDPVREKHIGGKVDIWVQGRNETTITDTFALQFDLGRDVRFYLDSEPSELIFVADDDRLSPENPITQLLGATSQEKQEGFGFRNATTGKEFDLAGYEIIDYNKIQLDTDIPQPSINVNDVVFGDYRFQTTNKYILGQQPVQSISSVVSKNTSTVLDKGVHYDLYKTEDPLKKGFSTKASDHILIRRNDGIPTGDTFVVNDEEHVLVSETPEKLKNIGVDPSTVRVFTLDRQNEYNGPNSNEPDFLIEEGDQTTPLRITRVPEGDIENGEEVSVDYEHDENFEVSYTINNLLQRVEKAINDQRHITADVSINQSIRNQVKLEMTVIIQSGANQSTIDTKIKSSISNVLNNKEIGESVYQSDIVKAVEDVDGVIYVIVPFTNMAFKDEALIVREDLNDEADVIEQNNTSKIYVMDDTLNHPTKPVGGEETLHRGVYQDNRRVDLLESYGGLKTQSNASYISGSEGISIQGYSDQTTLNNDGYNTTEEVEERRKELTANKVFISLDPNDSIENYSYDVTYQVFGDDSTQSLMVSDVSHLELGDISITYKERS